MLDELLAPIPVRPARIARDAALANASPAFDTQRAHSPPRTETPRPLVARYRRATALVGASLVIMAARLANFGASGDASTGSFGGNPGAPFSIDQQFLIAALIAVLMGIVLIYKGLMRAPALTLDASGVCGFTLLGSRHFAWSDIDRIEVRWDAFYKRQLIFHAVRGSETGGYGILAPLQIPVMTTKIDRSVDQIVAVARQFRPDVRFECNENPTLVAILEFFLRFTRRVHG